jgi:YgiT-type zinc finger domain-containing protein
MQEKTVEKLLRGGDDTAIVDVRADVCLKCGDRLYAPEVVELFGSIRTKLKERRTDGFRPVGQSFRVREAAESLKG